MSESEFECATGKSGETIRKRRWMTTENRNGWQMVITVDQKMSNGDVRKENTQGGRERVWRV